MQNGRALLLSLTAIPLLATVTRAQQASRAEPFGFRQGMTREEIIDSVGADSVIIDDGDVLVLSSAPKSDPDFPIYAVCVSAESGIAKVVGMSEGITTNSYGESLRNAFVQLRLASEAHYGKPMAVFDFLKTGSIWKQPNDWMAGLLENDRMLLALWAEDPQGVSVAEEARAISPEFGYVTITYEFLNFRSWKREHNESMNPS